MPLNPDLLILMNIRRIIGITLALVVGVSVFAQQPATGLSPSTSTQAASARSALTKFNLDFPGGTPGELVAAIQKALGRPLNVIIPTEQANRSLPPLKMSNIDAAQLFSALFEATMHSEIEYNRQVEVYLAFRTKGETSDDSIWTLSDAGSSPQAPRITRFFLLTPYLNQGLTVDDITTAIQTAWKMRNATSNPTISFHKETKLLIAVGSPMGLDTIDQALKALDGAKAKPTSATDVSVKSEEKQP